MSNRRKTPTARQNKQSSFAVVYGPPPGGGSAYRAAHAADSRRFLDDPQLTEFWRDMVPGEAPGLPPGTRVWVKRIDGLRIGKAYQTPDVGAN